MNELHLVFICLSKKVCDNVLVGGSKIILKVCLGLELLFIGLIYLGHNFSITKQRNTSEYTCIQFLLSGLNHRLDSSAGRASTLEREVPNSIPVTASYQRRIKIRHDQLLLCFALGILGVDMPLNSIKERKCLWILQEVKCRA